MQWLLAFAVIVQTLTITSELQSQTKIQWVKIGDSVSVCCSFSLKDEELLILSNDGYRLQTMLFSEEHGIQRMEANQNEFASKKPGWMVDPLDKSSSDLCVQKETGVSIQADDGEEFVCKVIAGRGIGAVTQQGIIRVKLYVPVSIDDITDVVLVKPNETATATCYASGYPELQLFWREKTTGNVLAKSNTSRSDTNELELDVPSFTPLKHGEMLECEARSGFPGDNNLAVGNTRVEIALPPNITVTSGLVHTDIGARENVQVYVTGYPTPVFHCGGLPLNSPVRVSDEPQGGTSMYEATVERITEEHLSIFECEAHNEAGTAVQPIEFTAAPSVPEILSLNTSRYADYYLLTWTANSRAPLRNVTVEIEEHPADNFSDFLDIPSPNIRTLTYPLGLTSFDDAQAFVELKNDSSAGRWQHTAWHHIANLTADTEHGIRLKVCNRYACQMSHTEVMGSHPFSLVFRTSKFNGSNNVDPLILLKSPLETARALAEGSNAKFPFQENAAACSEVARLGIPLFFYWNTLHLF